MISKEWKTIYASLEIACIPFTICKNGEADVFKFKNYVVELLGNKCKLNNEEVSVIDVVKKIKSL